MAVLLGLAVALFVFGVLLGAFRAPLAATYAAAAAAAAPETTPAPAPR